MLTGAAGSTLGCRDLHLQIYWSYSPFALEMVPLELRVQRSEQAICTRTAVDGGANINLHVLVFDLE